MDTSLIIGNVFLAASITMSSKAWAPAALLILGLVWFVSWLIQVKFKL